MKPKIAIVRGKFLNQYEMQSFEPLVNWFDLTAFGSLTPFHDQFAFPVVKLPSPMDLPEFPFKMPILNRIFVDAHYLVGLEGRLRGFDLVHTAETYYRYTQQALNAKRTGYVRKVMATVLENIPFNNEGIWGRKAFKARARRELDHVIALTNLTKQALIMEGCDPSKITVIGHGVDTKHFQTRKQRRMRSFHSRLALNILFAGRLEAYKGVFDVILAANSLLKDPELKRFSLTFVLVGEGSQRERVVELEKSLGIDGYFIHKHVAYGDMPHEYQQADIFVAPSKSIPTWQEQYSTVLLEAQAAGLPIVTTASGGISENVGNAALLVAPGDSQQLAQALQRFILSPSLRWEYGQKARQRAENVHDAEKIAQQIAAVYEKVLSG